jgi:hypothetical protein
VAGGGLLIIGIEKLRELCWLCFIFQWWFATYNFNLKEYFEYLVPVQSVIVTQQMQERRGMGNG